MKKLREQLSVRRREKKGYSVLYIVVFLLLILTPQLVTIFFPAGEITVLLQAMEKENTEVSEAPEPILNIESAIEVNTVSSEELIEMGFDEALATRWIHYRTAANGFKKAEDVKKLYGMKEELFEQIVDCLYLAEPQKSVEKRKESSAAGKYQNNVDAAEIDWAPFNPNDISKEELINLGLSEKAASAWVNYRKAIGEFTSVRQLEKVYGLPDDWLEYASEYISFPEKIEAEPVKQAVEQPVDVTEEILEIEKSVEINTTSVDLWLQFPEIDQVMADRIIKLGYLKGGFARVDELKEVYGIEADFIKKYRKYLYVANPEVISVGLTLDFINTASQEELRKHPLVSYNQAKLIEKYRSHHGEFASLQDLRKIRALSASWVKHVVELNEGVEGKGLVQER